MVLLKECSAAIVASQRRDASLDAAAAVVIMVAPHDDYRCYSECRGSIPRNILFLRKDPPHHASCMMLEELLTATAFIGKITMST